MFKLLFCGETWFVCCVDRWVKNYLSYCSIDTIFVKITLKHVYSINLFISLCLGCVNCRIRIYQPNPLVRKFDRIWSLFSSLCSCISSIAVYSMFNAKKSQSYLTKCYRPMRSSLLFCRRLKWMISSLTMDLWWVAQLSL